MTAIQTTLLGAALGLSTMGGSHLSLLTAASPSQRDATRDTTVLFSIGGMLTPDCPQRVKDALKDQPGVNSVSADRIRATATVRYDPTKTDPATLARRIEAETPFTATVAR